MNEEVVGNAINEAPADARWYVIHSQTGHEDRVKKNLQQRVESLGVGDKIFNIIVPTRETVVVKRGKKIKQMEKVFPLSLIHI